VATGNTHDTRPMRILVVDDEPDIRTMLEVVLAAEGWSVEQAGSGAEGLDAFRASNPDIVVLDHRMPGLTGWDVACQLIEEGCETPLVLFSAYLDADLRMRSEALGLTAVDKLDWHGLVETCRRFDRVRLQAQATVV
jgi:two-component system, OmpR family, response regulator RpaB